MWNPTSPASASLPQAGSSYGYLSSTTAVKPSPGLRVPLCPSPLVVDCGAHSQRLLPATAAPADARSPPPPGHSDPHLAVPYRDPNITTVLLKHLFSVFFMALLFPPAVSQGLLTFFSVLVNVKRDPMGFQLELPEFLKWAHRSTLSLGILLQRENAIGLLWLYLF